MVFLYKHFALLYLHLYLMTIYHTESASLNSRHQLLGNAQSDPHNSSIPKKIDLLDLFGMSGNLDAIGQGRDMAPSFKQTGNTPHIRPSFSGTHDVFGNILPDQGYAGTVDKHVFGQSPALDLNSLVPQEQHQPSVDSLFPVHNTLDGLMGVGQNALSDDRIQPINPNKGLSPGIPSIDDIFGLPLTSDTYSETGTHGIGKQPTSDQKNIVPLTNYQARNGLSIEDVFGISQDSAGDDQATSLTGYDLQNNQPQKVSNQDNSSPGIHSRQNIALSDLFPSLNSDKEQLNDKSAEQIDQRINSLDGHPSIESIFGVRGTGKNQTPNSNGNQPPNQSQDDNDSKLVDLFNIFNSANKAKEQSRTQSHDALGSDTSLTIEDIFGLSSSYPSHQKPAEPQFDLSSIFPSLDLSNNGRKLPSKIPGKLPSEISQPGQELQTFQDIFGDSPVENAISSSIENTNSALHTARGHQLIPNSPYSSNINSAIVQGPAISGQLGPIYPGSSSMMGLRPNTFTNNLPVIQGPNSYLQRPTIIQRPQIQPYWPNTLTQQRPVVSIQRPNTQGYPLINTNTNNVYPVSQGLAATGFLNPSQMDQYLSGSQNLPNTPRTPTPILFTTAAPLIPTTHPPTLRPYRPYSTPPPVIYPTVAPIVTLPPTLYPGLPPYANQDYSMLYPYRGNQNSIPYVFSSGAFRPLVPGQTQQYANSQYAVSYPYNILYCSEIFRESQAATSRLLGQKAPFLHDAFKAGEGHVGYYWQVPNIFSNLPIALDSPPV